MYAAQRVKLEKACTRKQKQDEDGDEHENENKDEDEAGRRQMFDHYYATINKARDPETQTV